jgi:protein NUD1
LVNLDVSTLSNLEIIHADSNRLSRIGGVNHLQHLRVLSLREQRPSALSQEGSDVSGLVHDADISNLSVSANVMTVFPIPNAFLNLKRLEAASCGMQALPDDFGVQVPNLRVLNVNFNAIRDISPLLNIRRLTKLYAAGNRISRLRKTLAVVAKLGTVNEIDLRNNPLTLGYYPPVVETRVIPVNGRYATRQEGELDDIHQQQEDERYTITAIDRESNELFSARLDKDTKLRKRVYEMMMAYSCPDLKLCDGLAFTRNDVLIKDEIWERLVQLGVLKKSSTTSERNGNIDSKLRTAASEGT